MKPTIIILSSILILSSCTGSDRAKNNQVTEKSMNSDSTNKYGYNRDFLKTHTDIIELRNGSSAIVIVPAWQGRVMTSTAEGDNGFSSGWINHDLIKSGKREPHINAFGGEERIWLGPEGGQFSLFFSKGKSFTFDDWQTPAFLDTTPWKVTYSADTTAKFAINVTAENFSGTRFNLGIEREVTLLSENETGKQTGIDVKGLRSVAFRSENTIINNGTKAWTRETGLISIWMLGMFNPSPSVVVVIPVKEGDENLLGPIVNDNYFGKISSDRLKTEGNHIFFRADGKSRGKIGIPPLRSTGKMGSYDAENKVLTLLICIIPRGKSDYVNSSWEIQDDPFSGDALNSYNDGPLEDGSQMGPFYELETSSPAADLKPGESLSHIQFTIHLTGNREILDAVALKTLGVNLEAISGAF